MGALELDEPLPHAGDGGDGRHARVNLGRADLLGAIDAIDKNARPLRSALQVDVERVGERSQGTRVARIHAALKRSVGHGAIHRARVKVREALALGQGPRDRRLSRAGGPVYGSARFPSFVALRADSERESSSSGVSPKAARRSLPWATSKSWDDTLGTVKFQNRLTGLP